MAEVSLTKAAAAAVVETPAVVVFRITLREVAAAKGEQKAPAPGSCATRK